MVMDLGKGWGAEVLLVAGVVFNELAVVLNELCRCWRRIGVADRSLLLPARSPWLFDLSNEARNENEHGGESNGLLLILN